VGKYFRRYSLQCPTARRQFTAGLSDTIADQTYCIPVGPPKFRAQFCSFQARLHSRENRLLASSCPSLRLSLCVTCLNVCNFFLQRNIDIWHKLAVFDISCLCTCNYNTVCYSMSLNFDQERISIILAVLFILLLL